MNGTAYIDAQNGHALLLQNVVGLQVDKQLSFNKHITKKLKKLLKFLLAKLLKKYARLAINNNNHRNSYILILPI